MTCYALRNINTVTAYYNEHDPYAAQWLRNLITAGHIASGEVDERSIEDVLPTELAEYTQCHFFAGIGVWSLALRRAGWADDRPVWTGSCPCQPFSAAGQGLGLADERHLWPAFGHLIKECKPASIFGEQVSSKDADAWIDLVQDDMEGMGYAVAAIAFPSACVGAPHIRDRMYWVADSASIGRTGGRKHHRSQEQSAGTAPTLGSGLRKQTQERGAANGFWHGAEWIGCLDGRQRPVEPGTRPLAASSTARVGRLRAYGNAINAAAAQEFIRAYLEA